MADITKCANAEDCPLKASCYRNTAKETEHHQSWANFFDPTDPDPENCENYWDIRN